MSSDAHLQVPMRLTRLIGSEMARHAQIPPRCPCIFEAVQQIIAPAHCAGHGISGRLSVQTGC